MILNGIFSCDYVNDTTYLITFSQKPKGQDQSTKEQEKSVIFGTGKGDENLAVLFGGVINSRHCFKFKGLSEYRTQ